MKAFADVVFHPAQCQRELSAFGKLLASRANLSERNDLLPFFKKRKQLASFLGTFTPNIGPAPLTPRTSALATSNSSVCSSSAEARDFPPATARA